MIEHLNWELSVLGRAVAYSNLSGASSHVGISQPQLSRIVVKLEEQLGVMLLDRSSKRNTSWTPAALKVVEIYSSVVRNFQGEVQKLNQETAPAHLRIATLEGLVPLALKFVKNAMKQTEAKVFELQVQDLNDLEELFFKHQLDLIFTLREPGRKKFKYMKNFGYQTLEPTGKEGGMEVMSSYEFGSKFPSLKNLEDGKQILVSNSLDVRKTWIASCGGRGILPSEIKKTKGADDIPVLLIGSDELPASIWKAVSHFKY